MDTIEVTHEDKQEPSSYYGPTKERPEPLFNPNIDILINDFVCAAQVTKHYL